MIIIDITYKVPLEQIDAHMEAHVAYLDKYYASGNFVTSGRKVPREGGIILVSGMSKEQVQEVIKEDPFYQNELADYKVTEFAVGKKATHIDTLFT